MYKNICKLFKVIVLNICIILITVSSCAPVQKPILMNGEDDRIILSLWHLSVFEPNPEQDSLIYSINEWNRLNKKVKIKSEGINIEQYKSKIKTALAAGEAPDIFYMWGGSFVRPYIESKNILMLDSYINDGTKEKIVPGVLEACTFDRNVYGLPTYTFIANLYCNNEIFNKAGLKLPRTFDELLNSAKVLRSKGITPISLGEKDRWPGMYWYDIIALRQAGSQKCLKAFENPKLFKDNDFKIAADKLLELIKVEAFNDNSFGISFDEMQDDFIKGKSAMVYQGTWVEGAIESNNSKVKGKISVIPFPTINGGKGKIDEFYGGNVDGFYVNINTISKEEAVRALKYICENTGKRGYIKSAGLSCWEMDDKDISMLPPLTHASTKLFKTAKSNVEWWDTIFEASDADLHKGLVAELFAERITSENFIKEMAKLKGVQIK